MHHPRRAWLLSLVLVLVLAGIRPAGAHHILGIPHYAYDENYPQLPFVEIMAQCGAWDLRMSYFPGIIQPGERIRFKLYGRHRESGEPLRLPLTGQVQRTSFGHRPVTLGEAFPIEVGKGPEGNDYKFFLSFPGYDSYSVLVRFDFPDGSREEIPFPVTVGVTDDTPLLGATFLLLVLAVLATRVLKQRQRADRQGRTP